MSTLKEAKYELVVSKIKPVMLKHGVGKLKIKDIAKKIEVGEATLYRYFGNKTTMVIEVGISLWKDIYQELAKITKGVNGYESVSKFFLYFLDGYKKQKEVFLFLDEFDALMVSESISMELLKGYDQALMHVKSLYDYFYESGLKDQSINNTVDQNEFYYTTTHMILGICKRLAANGVLLESDSTVMDEIQIKLAIEICMNYIKNESEIK